MYCVLSKDQGIVEKFDTLEFWDNLISEMVKRSEETGVGDVKDRVDTLMKSFNLPTSEDYLEEFDGQNHEDARRLIFVVSLPVIMRGHAIKIKASSELLTLRVPTLYSLALGLPCKANKDHTFAYFDCKLRKLFVVLKVARPEDEIPVDGDSSASDIAEKTVVVEVVDTKKLENDLLFDLV